MKRTILGAIGLLFLCQLSFGQSLVFGASFGPEIEPSLAQLSLQQEQAAHQLRYLWAEAAGLETPAEGAWQREVKAWEATWQQLSDALAAQELAAFEEMIEQARPSAWEDWIEAEAKAISQEEKVPHFSPTY